MIAVVTGATGLIGKELVEILLQDDNYKKVISAVRRPTGLTHSKYQEVEVDFEKLADYQKKLKGDHYFCCLGTTIKVAKTKENFRKVDYVYPYEFAKIALAHKAKSYSIVTAIGANAKSMVFYSRTKGEVEEAINGLGLPALNIYRPSFLKGTRPEDRPGEKLGLAVFDGISFLMQGPLKQYRVIEGRVVAQVMATEALGFSGTNYINSDRIQKIYDSY